MYIITTFLAIQLCHYNFHNNGKIYSRKIMKKYSNENVINHIYIEKKKTILKAQKFRKMPWKIQLCATHERTWPNQWVRCKTASSPVDFKSLCHRIIHIQELKKNKVKCFNSEIYICIKHLGSLRYIEKKNLSYSKSIYKFMK